MTTTRDELAALMGLSAKATQGEWSAVSRGRYWGDDEGSVYGPDGEDIVGVEMVEPVREADTIRGEIWHRDAAFIAACVNFLRTRGAELVELVGDAERYRWLRDNADMQWGGPIGRTCIFQPSTYQPHEIDAAIDAMRADGGGNGGG